MALNVTVVVLGEIAQSPRMLNHVRSLLELGVQVDLVAYAGDITPDWLRHHPTLRLHRLGRGGSARRHRFGPALFLLYSAARLVALSAALTLALGVKARRPDAILVQVPPSIPTCAVAALIARLRGAKLIIDWHNYGYTMLALRLGAGHALVRLARAYEKALARVADHHFCVSQAMGRDLEVSWGLKAPRVLYDRPRAAMPPLSDQERLAFFERLEVALPEWTRTALAEASAERPALLVSPTSWTLDENFAALVEALPLVDRALAERGQGQTAEAAPRLLVVITGRGPRREHWEAALERLALKCVLIRTAWLTAEDFRALLCLADLGLCFHTSSSGLDLPMKIVDMMAAGLPVCAFDYGPCLGEQVRPGENGVLFKDGPELAERLTGLLAGFPETDGTLAQLRRSARWRGPLWREEWQEVAAPAFGIAQGVADPQRVAAPR